MMADDAQSLSIVRRDLAVLITKALNLDMAPEDIEGNAPLFGDGLGLDSIDILEIALVVAKEYGVQLKADGQDRHLIFSSLNSLSEFVDRQRTK